MEEQNDEVLKVLVDIRDTLNRIYTCFEDQYIEIQKNKPKARVSKFKAMLDKDVRKTIFPLLFDKRHLSQKDIAELAKTSQPTVSRFVTELIDNGLIEQAEEKGKTIYRDKYDLLKSLEK